MIILRLNSLILANIRLTKSFIRFNGFSITKLASSESIETQSVKSYVLVGLIFYVLGTIGWSFWMIGMGFAFFGSSSQMMGNMGFTPGFFPFVFPMGVFFALTAGFAVWSWITWDNIRKGKYAEARTATLILGIFGIFLAWLIGGIFLLLAYGKLGTVIEGPKAPQATPQLAGRICVHCGKPIAWDAKFCEHCGEGLE